MLRLILSVHLKGHLVWCKIAQGDCWERKWLPKTRGPANKSFIQGHPSGIPGYLSCWFNTKGNLLWLVGAKCCCVIYTKWITWIVVLANVAFHCSTFSVFVQRDCLGVIQGAVLGPVLIPIDYWNFISTALGNVCISISNTSGSAAGIASTASFSTYNSASSNSIFSNRISTIAFSAASPKSFKL